MAHQHGLEGAGLAPRGKAQPAERKTVQPRRGIRADLKLIADMIQPNTSALDVGSGDGELLVLDDINLRVQEGEILGLLGRTGSGKSTLLRLISGLAQTAAGSISYLGRAVEGPAPGIAMVFQSFALFPWLTVLENVELGLEALGLPANEIRRRSLAARSGAPS